MGFPGGLSSYLDPGTGTWGPTGLLFLVDFFTLMRSSTGNVDDILLGGVHAPFIIFVHLVYLLAFPGLDEVIRV